jgi:hypothetical protein
MQFVFAFASLGTLKHGARKIEERQRAFLASTELQRNLKSYKKMKFYKISK